MATRSPPADPLKLDRSDGSATLDLYRAVLGPMRRDYYLHAFTRFDAAGKSGLSWNWAAALLTLNWMLFRQLWAAALAYVGALTAGLLLCLGLGRLLLGQSELGTWGLLALALLAAVAIPGALGNAWLYAVCNRKMETALRDSATLEEACARLARQASSSLRMAVLAGANLVLLGAVGAAALSWPEGGLASLAGTSPVHLDSGQPVSGTVTPASAASDALPVSALAATSVAAAAAAAAPPASAASAAQTAASAPGTMASATAAAPASTASSATLAALPAAMASAPAAKASSPASNLASSLATAQPAAAVAPPVVAAAAPAAAALAASAPARPGKAATPAATAQHKPAHTPAGAGSHAKGATPPPAKAKAPSPAPAGAHQPTAQAAAHAKSATVKPAAKTAKAGQETQAAASAAKVPKATAAAGDTASEAFVLNVGLFADENNARNAYTKLKDAGLPAQSQALQFPKGLRTRVRVGPFATQAEAERAAEQVRALKLDAVLGKP